MQGTPDVKIAVEDLLNDKPLVTAMDEEIIISQLDESCEAVRYNDFIKALIADDIYYMNQYMNQITETVFSSFDTGKHPFLKHTIRHYGFAFKGKKFSSVKTCLKILSGRCIP